MTALTALAARCEAADASEQRELLEQAWAALNPSPQEQSISAFATISRQELKFDPENESAKWVKRTQSFHDKLDAEAFESAAMLLVPEGWHTGAYYQGPSGQPHRWILRTIKDGEIFYREKEATATTPSLALAAAALKARA